MTRHSPWFVFLPCSPLRLRLPAGGLHTKLSEITHQETRQEVLCAVQTLSSHHIVAVTQALLAYPLPYDE